uniref:Uncharacterized protein n=1 Tax=Arundo donax TaxID=35708 RepID=A0A0A9ADK0_ARUDO
MQSENLDTRLNPLQRRNLSATWF